MDKRNFLIVGGSSGIGLAITRQLVEQGHDVFVGSRSAGSIPAMNNVHHFQFDVLSDEIPLDKLPESLHGVVYCPGTINLRPFRQLKEEDFVTDFRINLLGAVKTIQTVLSNLKKAEETASIVLFSTVAVQTGMAFHASIASAKGAVEGLTRSLAAELAPKIRVNCIAPSLTNTPLAARLLANEEKQKATADRHPLKRFGEPRDIANLACFLLNEESSWITGQILHVDGGMSSVKMF
ncbi:SDR family oxidoreductase [candidate division KSB1 bacterium]|nr:SDR family oxidoreductase [candidate division KSB1 bacterium]